MPLNIFFYTRAADAGAALTEWAISERPVGTFVPASDLGSAFLSEPDAAEIAAHRAIALPQTVREIVSRYAARAASETAPATGVIGLALTEADEAGIRMAVATRVEAHRALRAIRALDSDTVGTVRGLDGRATAPAIPAPTPADAAGTVRAPFQVRMSADGTLLVEGVPRPPRYCGVFWGVESRVVAPARRDRFAFFAELGARETGLLDRENTCSRTLVLTQAALVALIAALQIAQVTVNGAYNSDKTASAATNLSINVITLSLPIVFTLFTIFLSAVKGQAMTYQANLEGIQKRIRVLTGMTDVEDPLPGGQVAQRDEEAAAGGSPAPSAGGR